VSQERDAKMAELKTLGTKLEAVQEDALPLQAKLRAAAAQVKSLTEARDEAMAEAEAAHRDLVELQQERKAGSAALEAELDTAKEACEAAEVSRRSAEAESEKLRRALEKQVEATKNAENDMRLMYKRHKKETQEVADKFRAGEYEARYEAAVAKAAQLEGLLANWVNYAKEVNQLRTLHGQLDEADARAAAEARGLIDDADAMRADAETKCAKWERQCARMQKEMTELVGIKTRALEQRKEIHERYVELLEELKAQGEYASSLEEEVAALQEQLANVPAQLDAAREAGVDAERARGPSTESQIEAVITEMVTSVEQSMLQARVASLEEELQEHVAASEASDRLFEQTAVAMQDKDETCATLAAQLAKAQGELADAVHRTEENRVSSEAESAASQEALDEMTRSLAAEKERAEEADARAKACAAAAACGIARLTHVTVGMASGEDDTTELIDPELRLHWCDDSYEAHLAGSKTPAELRALLVSVTSTAEALLNKACERGEAQAAQLTELQMAMFNLEARREEAAQEAKAAAERLAEAQRDLAAMEEAKEASSAEAAAKTELIAVLEETVADSNASAAAAKEEKEELSAMLEETTRENMALSEAKQEAEAAIPERDMLRAQLEESHIARGKAEAAEARARESVQKRIATLTANLTKSDAEAASLECLIAHVRAVLQQTIEEPSGPASEQTLRALLSRISTEESHDDE
jgi:chromosome segregation ATPase